MNESDFLTYTFPYEEPPLAAQRGALGTGGCRRTVSSKQSAVSSINAIQCKASLRLLVTTSWLLVFGFNLQSLTAPNKQHWPTTDASPGVCSLGLQVLPNLSRREDPQM